jgi:hypothetical protein
MSVKQIIRPVPIECGFDDDAVLLADGEKIV